MALITLSEFHTYDDAPSPTENDDQITAIIDLASDRIEKYVGRPFSVADPSPIEVVETLNGRLCPRIYTKYLPILSVDKLEYFDGFTWTEYDIVNTPYTFKEESNIAYFTQGHVFIPGYRNIRVTYTYGYDEVPDQVKLACFLLTKWYLHEAERTGINSQQDGEQSFSYSHTIPSDVMAILAQYKRMAF